MSRLHEPVRVHMRPIMLALATLTSAASALHAATPVTLSFENVAGAGGLVNISPSAPYSEAGFTLTPTNGSSAVFDATATSDMPGNVTSWFGFAESNTITLRHALGRPFDLISLVMGRSTIATTSTISLTFSGTMVGGNNLSGTRFGLSSAEARNLNWKNLTQFTLSASDDAGVDDIAVAVVPEPSAGVLAGVAIVAVRRLYQRNTGGRRRVR